MKELNSNCFMKKKSEYLKCKFNSNSSEFSKRMNWINKCVSNYKLNKTNKKMSNNKGKTLLRLILL